MRSYQLIRSDRKTLSLEITKELEVVVRAPNRLPKAEIDKFVLSHERWIVKHLELRKEKNEGSTSLTEEDIVNLKRQAASILPERVKYFSSLMGLVPSCVKITSAKTRFGSCSGRNSICFSWRLMQYPEKAVDYVVVHELAHIKHKNHSKAFYQEIKKYLPDYKECQGLLKQNPVH